MSIPVSRRLRFAIAATALAAPLVALMGPAQATAPPTLGATSVNPTTGLASETSTLLETHGTCPAPSQGVKARLEGPGITDDTKNNLVGNTGLGVLAPNGFGGYELNMTKTFSDVLLAYGVSAPSGDYTIEVVCQDNSLNVYGIYSGAIHVAHGASDAAGDGTYTSISSAVTTTTTVQAPTPAAPVAQGDLTSLSATVDPANAVGSVQFKRGGVNVGAPVAVSSGTASLAPTALSSGAGALTAVFTATDSNAFKTSTSAAVPYVVAGKPAITGTVAVGQAVTCSAVAGGTHTYAWQLNGVAAPGVTAATVVVPATWLAKSLTCSDSVTVSPNPTAVVQTSAGRTVAVGAALRATRRPTVTGTFKVGKVLTVHAGTWSPAATTYTYQWLRAGRPIAGRTRTTYKLVRADKGKLISCRVTAKKVGYVNGTSTTAAKKSA